MCRRCWIVLEPANLVGPGCSHGKPGVQRNDDHVVGEDLLSFLHQGNQHGLIN